MEGGGCVNAEAYVGSTGNIVKGGSSGLFTRVDFDMAVAAEASGGGKGKLQVFAIGGVEGGAERKSSFAKRIAVLVKLPPGDPVPE